ncbi:PKD-like domain-containing protein [Flavobacterium terrisoli]|uniref:PKD-like domain-containing protein n=1 Tax=Flavobacterium terrisoli TaxID=3242195 RepID=UPI002542EA50|nr:PKD-like domain-containing protein [Flavobacterium buctense]
MKKNYLLSEKKQKPELFFSKKYILVLVVLILLISKSSSAQTAGPNNPTTGNFIAGANLDWTNPGNITNTADANYATAVFGAAGNTDNLQGTNYGFAIPSGAIINGIVVTINRRTSAVNAGRITRDNLVSLVKGGTVTGNNKATATAYTTTFATATYGSSTDTWGTTWTPTDINATNFGAVLSVNANNSLTATVDYIRITVHYTTLGFSPSSACIGSGASIVITGNYIAGTTAVSFNGTAAAFVQNSNTQVTATLPAGATTGTISLTTPQGTGTTTTNFTVNPLPVLAAITGTTSVCVGSTTTLSNSTAGGTWSSASPLVATVNPASGIVSGVAAGTSLITYTYTNGNGCTNSVNTTVTVDALPVVSAPASVCLGDTAQLTPNSGGTWISNDLSKATVDNSGLVTAIATGNVTFTFTNSTTTCSNTTSALSVLALPAITSHPAASQTICSASSVSLSVGASGAGLTYQWYNGANPLSNGGSISGATSATLTINPIALSDASTDYHCVVSGTCTPSVASNNAEIIVIEKVTITLQPTASQTFCTGETAVFSVAATGSGLTYQWYNGASALVDSATISGATTDTLTLSSLTSGDASANYHCLVTGTNPCSAVNSANATLIVNQSASITSQPQASQNICENGSVSISVSAIGGSLVYQWYKGATLLSNGGNISGANTATLTINPIALSDAASDYNCIVSNGCSSGDTSNNAEIIVSPKAYIPAQTITVCDDNAFSLTPVNGVPNAETVVPANTTYSWSAPIVTGGITGGTAQSGQTSISGTLNNPTNTNQTATYTVTPTTGTSPACSGAAFTVTVTVKPSATIQNITTSVCTDGTINITPANGGGNIIPNGTTYSWSAPVVTGGVTGGTAESGQTSISQTLSNPTNVPQTVTYTITPDSATCSGGNFTLTVTVNPRPVSSISPVSQTACSDVLFSPIVVSNTNSQAVTYNWTRDNTTNVFGTASGTSGAIAIGNPFSLSQILTNNTTTAQTVIYTFTPVSSNGCSGSPITSTVVLNVPSDGGTASISQPNVTPVVRTTTVCHFGSGTIYLSGHTGTVVRWESTTNGGTTWTPIANTTTSHTYSNITQTTFFRAVVQNGASCNLAYSYIALIDVIPNIKPSPVTATPQTICVGGSSVLYSESGFSTSSYLANGGTFSNANPDNWLVDGCGNCLNAGGSNTTEGPFRLSATNGGTYSGINYASIGKFAIANGNFNSIMQTPIFNTFGLTSASLSFNHAFNLQAGASVSIQLSLDGGTTYSVVLASYTGPATRSPYNAFPNQTIDLSAYIGQPNLRIRFVYNGTVNSSWAIDNIMIPETPSNLTTQWVDSITGQVISNTASVTVTPPVTTTYAVTSYLNGCTSYGPEGTTYITVTVNPRPTANIGPNQTICLGSPATFSVALTGTAPWSITYSNGSTTTTVNNITTNPYVFNVNGITTNRTFTITALSDSRCTSNPSDLSGSAVVTVLNGTPGLWTGAVSTDWFDCKNWAGGMPSATIDAQIPAGAVRMPLIDPATSSFAAFYSNIARARDIIIANGATLTMAASGNSDLYVSRDWRNSGNFTPGTGTVTFNGSTVNQIQTINAGIKTSENFYNFTLNTSNSARGISVVTNFELTVANNLHLQSGDLRLVGEAQIVQSGTGANPSTGTGRILKDQQGTQSSYHYNYWSSPVSTNGINYTIGGVLRDGADSSANPFTPSALNFNSDVNFADGALTFPANLSSGWMFKFTSVSVDYAGWQYIGDTGTVNIGEGFTMKGTTGTGSATAQQNYVFVGKPNNGTIGLNISPNQSYLVGNPYPSALDADEFIKDNIKDGAGRAATNIFNGALYFWDHFGGQTHILNQYVGGYATYSLMGGVVALSNDPLTANNGSAGTKTPKRYIPVAQGFFIGTGPTTDLTGNNPGLSTPVTGGTVTFKNTQRVFKAESATDSQFFRTQNGSQNEDTVNDDRQKIRLVFESPNQSYRQILVGVDENATNSFDIGYDAPMIDLNADDLYWNISDAKFAIQAVSNFNSDQIIPIGITTSVEGLTTVKIAALENISESTDIYIHDNESGVDHNIRNSDFSISLPIGEYNNRFSLRFAGQALGVNTPNENDPIVYFTNIDNSLNIKNTNLNLNLKSVTLFNLLGQQISTYSLENTNQQDIKIPVLNIASGTYIVKIATDTNQSFSQKIIKN